MSRNRPEFITTADNVQLKIGDRAFNHYDMHAGYIGLIDASPQPDTMKGQDSSTPIEEWDNYWFNFIQDNNTQVSLDGLRICSIEFAQKKGWVK